LDHAPHVAIQTVLFCEALLLKTIKQGWIEGVYRLFVNYKHAAESVIHQASATIWPDGDLAKSLISHLLIVLVEHVIEVLLNLI
jgi:hypothetical protein